MKIPPKIYKIRFGGIMLLWRANSAQNAVKKLPKHVLDQIRKSLRKTEALSGSVTKDIIAKYVKEVSEDSILKEIENLKVDMDYIQLQRNELEQLINPLVVREYYINIERHLGIIERNINEQKDVDLFEDEINKKVSN